MSIHTAEISTLLTGPVAIKFMRNQKIFDRRKLLEFINDPESKPMSSELYVKHGFQKLTIAHNVSLCGSFRLYIILNLESLRLQRMTVKSFDCTEQNIKECIKQFKNKLTELTDSKVQFQSLIKWSIKRIDYCIDCKVDNPELYIELLKKGRMPRALGVKQNHQGSHYLESKSDNITINFYDKENQIRKIHNIPIDKEDQLTREARNMIRLEVQCQDRKVKHVKEKIEKKIGSCKQTLGIFLYNDLSDEVVRGYYKVAIGYSDFFDFDSAVQRIREYRWRKDTKQNLIRFLELVNHEGSVAAAKNAYETGRMKNGEPAMITGSKNTLNSILNGYLPQIGVSPVTIPDKYQIMHLVNICKPHDY